MAEKEGYLSTTQAVPRADFMDIYMVPLKKVHFRVVKRRAADNKIYDEELLDVGQKAILSITQQNHTGYAVYRQFPFDKKSPEVMTVDLILDDMVYDLDLVVLDKDNKLIGGYRGKWSLDQKDAESANEIIFRVMEVSPIPETEKDQANALIQIQDIKYAKFLDPLLR
jgi:hypothetical protein